MPTTYRYKLRSIPGRQHGVSTRGLPTGLAHRALVETILGKPLPRKAEVHHVNGNTKDNRHTNLVVCENASYHQLLHVRQRVLAAGGNPNTQRICVQCHQLVPIEVFKKRKNGRSTNQCPACMRLRVAAYRLANIDTVRAKDRLRSRARWLRQSRAKLLCQP